MATAVHWVVLDTLEHWRQQAVEGMARRPVAVAVVRTESPPVEMAACWWSTGRRLMDVGVVVGRLRRWLRWHWLPR